MNLRDRVSLATGIVIGLAGIIATLLWRVEAGVVAILVLGLLLLLLSVLQRRQLAKIQSRTLAMLNPPQAQKKPAQYDSTKVEQDLAISTKKIVGLLQAHQVGLDLLNHRLDQAMRGEPGGDSRS